MPRFSVVVPTRDRPDLLEFCLAGIAGQTSADFEVVVSDNPTTQPARAVFDRWARPGWRFLTASDPVPMHENFERACAAAQGDFVAVVIDKTVLHPSALHLAAKALEAHPGADIVTWWSDGYDPADEAGRAGRGRLQLAEAVTAPEPYDPRAELARRFENAERRGADPVHYFRGKVVFGAYSHVLIERIRALGGRLFHPLAPDYTSMVPACVLSDGAVDVGRPLLVSYNSIRSNGRMQLVDPAHARRFIEASDPAIVQALPIPGLYASQHNVVAYDLASAAARCPAGTAPELDLANLVRRAREDLDGVAWPNESERAAQYALLEAVEARLGIVPPPPPPPPPRPGVVDVLAGALAHVPPAQRMIHRLLRRPEGTGRDYASPVDAATAADRHYAASASA